MKDKIIKIIQKDNLGNNQLMNMYLPQDINKDASEIADMVKAFTEWKDLETIVQRQTRYTVKYLLLDLDAPPDLMTLDELFNYWYDNIKDK